MLPFARELPNTRRRAGTGRKANSALPDWQKLSVTRGFEAGLALLLIGKLEVGLQFDPVSKSDPLVSGRFVADIYVGFR